MDIRKAIIPVSGVAALALPAVATASDAQAGKAMFDMVANIATRAITTINTAPA